jgi:pimeloyl-ACP methyl ester carboxylesterase
MTTGFYWFRSNVNAGGMLEPGPELPPVRATLGLWSTGDAYLTERQMTDSALDHYERIEDASHWMQLDQPERIGALILQHLC